MAEKNIFKKYTLYYQENGKNSSFIAGSHDYNHELEEDSYIDDLQLK